MSRAAEVRFERVWKRFGANSVAVRDVSFTVAAGTLCTLLGPSGCGKTTTLRMIAGLEFPSEGRVMIGGRDVSALPPAERDVSMVFQSYALFPHMSVLENVCYGLTVSRLPRRQAEAAGRAALESVGLAGFDARLPSELSGGQQQRVAVARAFHVWRPKGARATCAHPHADLLEQHGSTITVKDMDGLRAVAGPWAAEWDTAPLTPGAASGRTAAKRQIPAIRIPSTGNGPAQLPPVVPCFTGPASRVTLPPPLRTSSQAAATSGTPTARWPKALPIS